LSQDIVPPVDESVFFEVFKELTQQIIVEFRGPAAVELSTVMQLCLGKQQKLWKAEQVDVITAIPKYF